jgi:hypothetical protein
MLEMRTRTRTRTRIAITAAPTDTVRGPRTRLQLELRDVAEEITGRVDRDELSRSDEEDVTEAIDAAVAAALPDVVAALDRELTPRLEALPLATRLTLAQARRRRDFGLD